MQRERFSTWVDSPPVLLLFLLLSADAAFLALHLVNDLSPAVNNRLYAVHVDRSYAEVFQYLKFVWTALLLAIVAIGRRSAVLGAWALLILYLAADDCLRLHERGGEWLVSHYGLGDAFGLRGQDLGELAVSAVAGGVLLGLVAACSVRAEPDGRNASKGLIVLLGLLVFFGVFVDLLHVAVPDALAKGLDLIEDGGEMAALSAMTSYAFRLRLARGSVPRSRMGGALAARFGMPSFRATD